MTQCCPPINQHLDEIKGKICLLRVDLNVPVKDGKILDDSRIDFILPTIKKLLANKNRIILISHFGRPKGEYDEKYSLHFLIEPLTKKLSHKVCFLKDIKERIKNDCNLALLENIRFYKGELDNSPEFAENLAKMGDIYINEAFSVSHRQHASVCAIRNFLPSFLGPQTEKEVATIKSALQEPKRPFTAILSGAKVSTKLGVINGLIDKVDNLILAGGIANTFLKAIGKEIGESIAENSMLEEARKIINSDAADKIKLPTDFMIAPSPNAEKEKIEATKNIKPGYSIFDIGPESINNFKQVIESSHTLIWNGPLGMFEVEPYDRATKEIATYIKKRTKSGDLFSIIGGGETIAAIKKAGLELNDFSYASTAGGAFLELIEGKKLPGIE